ncbi:hypothetical protein [Chitinophaga caseinilytica]|uniref:PH domain-containing protein n=1 Tax=Chitinophaga caseinilytica TaxID=2267521 RepID=A0ABZ2Z717_9BACT
MQAMARKMSLRFIGILSVALLFAFCMMYFMDHAVDPEVFRIELVIFPVVAVAMVIWHRMRLKKALAPMASLTIVITDTMIIREMDGMEMQGIYHRDIRSISKIKQGHFVVRGKSATEVLYIPNYLERLPELEAALQALHPIDAGAAVKTMQAGALGIAALLFVSMMGTVVLSDPWLAVPSAIVFVAVGIWGINWIRNNKNIPEKTRKRAWWMLLLIVVLLLNMVTRIWFLKS